MSTKDMLSEIFKQQTEQQRALLNWCNTGGKDLFQEPTYKPAHFEEVKDWIRNHERYSQGAKNKFILGQDIKLIAEALGQCEINRMTTVVTCEVSKPRAIERIKIPDVCKGLEIPCIVPYVMLRQEKPHFILKAG